MGLAHLSSRIEKVMAETAVSTVVRRISNIAIQETSLLCAVTGEVDLLKGELERLQGFLKDADSKQRSGNASVAVWVRQIRVAAYEAENIIEVAAYSEKRNSTRRGFVGAMSKYMHVPSNLIVLHTIGVGIRRVRRKIQEITNSASTLGILDLGWNVTAEPKSLFTEVFISAADDDIVVGFQNDADQIERNLTNIDNKQLTVISICATGGAGKTALARKLYSSVAVRGHFDAFAFVSFSQKFEFVHVLKDMIEQAMQIKRNTNEFEKLEELEKTGIKEAMGKLHEFLKEKRYLIVLDDVWTMDTWDAIKQSFPDVLNGSRVLLTTRNFQAANQANKLTHVHQLRLLDEKESWQLFCLKAFPSYENIDVGYRLDLESLGKNLVKKCGGLPLAIVVLGGHLSKNLHLNTWSEMDCCLNWEVTGKWENMQHIIAHSFHDIQGHHLKSCFLYMASFPKGFLISAFDLIRSWIAEGFIPHRANQTLEETARNYLEELAQRSMLHIFSRSYSDGWVEHVQMHDILHEWAVQEASKDGFLKICKNHGDLHVSSSYTVEAYRICFLHFCDDEISRHAPNLRTMLGFHLSNVTFQSLRFLKILSLYDSSLENFSKEIVRLIHLRYIKLRLCRNVVLPSSIGRLLNLQSIDVRGSELPFIPESLWDIATLRHVEFQNVKRLTPPRAGKQKELQTLRIYGKQLTRAHNYRWRSMEKSLANMKQITSLVLSGLLVPEEILTCLSDHDRLIELHLNVQLGKTGFPCSSSLPKNLRKLFLIVDTPLQVDPMPVLGNLRSLVFLRLITLECEVGSMMFTALSRFPCLQDLELWYVPVQILKFETGTAPKLYNMTLWKCGQMTRLPDGLLDLPSLKKLELEDMVNLVPRDSLDELEEKGCKLINIKPKTRPS